MNLLQSGTCLEITFDDSKGISKVLQVEISAEFTGGNSVIGCLCLHDHAFFHAFIRPDIGNIVAAFFQLRHQSNIRRNMTGRSTAC